MLFSNIQKCSILALVFCVGISARPQVSETQAPQTPQTPQNTQEPQEPQIDNQAGITQEPQVDNQDHVQATRGF